MNLNYLECFASLSDTLSFTETAREFSVSQPSISRQIRLLEEQLNTKLFIRDKHKVHLTDEGVAFKQRVTPLIKELQSVMNTTQDKTNDLSGRVQFGCLGEVGQYTIMDMILQFNEDHPNLDLQVVYTSPEKIIDKVKNGQLDFGLVNEMVDQENIRTFEVLKERSVLVTRKGNKKALDDVSNAKFVCYTADDSLLVTYVHKFHKKASMSKLNRHIIVNSHKSMIDALVSTDTYAVLPYFSVEQAIKDKELRIASEKELSSSIYLIHVDNNLMPKKNMIFKKHLMELCKKKKI